jgi:hypothetical protein
MVIDYLEDGLGVMEATFKERLTLDREKEMLRTMHLLRHWREDGFSRYVALCSRSSIPLTRK